MARSRRPLNSCPRSTASGNRGCSPAAGPSPSVAATGWTTSCPPRGEQRGAAAYQPATPLTSSQLAPSVLRGSNTTPSVMFLLNPQILGLSSSHIQQHGEPKADPHTRETMDHSFYLFFFLYDCVLVQGRRQIERTFCKDTRISMIPSTKNY